MDRVQYNEVQPTRSESGGGGGGKEVTSKQSKLKEHCTTGISALGLPQFEKLLASPVVFAFLPVVRSGVVIVNECERVALLLEPFRTEIRGRTFALCLFDASLGLFRLIDLTGFEQSMSNEFTSTVSFS